MIRTGGYGQAGEMVNSVVEQSAIFARTQPDKTAMIAHGKKISYGELYAAVCGFGAFLREKGLEKGGFVVCRAAASLTYWIAYLGVQLAGGIFVPLEKDCAAKTMRAVGRSLGKVFAVISGGDDAETARALGCALIRPDDAERPAGDCRGRSAVTEFPHGDDIGQIIFTTGTTGKAKGVVLQHKYITRSAFAAADIPYGPDTVMILPSPMNHILSIGRCTSVLLHGGTAVLLDGLTDLGSFYAALARYKANSMALTPSALNYIVTLSGEELAGYDGQLSFIEIGGEKLPRCRQTELLKLLPSVRFFIMYGSTENGATCCYEFSAYGAAENRIGRPASGTEILFLDESWREKAATRDDPGFIAVRSGRQMLGYWQDAAATAKVKRGDLIMMSDYGYCDEEGFVCLAGRAGDVIIAGGHKIDPAEVEEAALASGLLTDCVCVGHRDAVFGMLVKLIAVAKDRAAFDRTALKNYLVERLESCKVPKVIELADAVVRNANGKLDRKAYV